VHITLLGIIPAHMGTSILNLKYEISLPYLEPERHPYFGSHSLGLWLGSTALPIVVALTFFPFSHYSSFDLVDTLRNEFKMTYVGTLQSNRKGLPADFKNMEGREDGDYVVLYDVTGKKSIHSWINNKKGGESLFLKLLSGFRS
jgi:hypothetical protein